VKKGDFIHFTKFVSDSVPTPCDIWGICVDGVYFKLFLNEPDAWKLDEDDGIMDEDEYEIIQPEDVPDEILAQLTKRVLLNELTI
jgi:hypothetical protein